MVDAIADYRNGIEKHPVRAQVEEGYLRPLLPDRAPEEPEGLPEILADVRKHILPGITHWQHPSFFAWFPGNSSAPGLLADMLSDALGVVGFSWQASPAATELEGIAVDWFGRFLNLPGTFLGEESGGKGGGCIQGSASEACLVALLAAKARKLGRSAAGGLDVGGEADTGAAGAPNRIPVDPSKLVAYATDQAHSCVKKACMIAGVEHMRLVETREEDGWRMRGRALREAMARDRAAGLEPFFVTTLVGSTGVGACDPIPEIVEAAAESGAWVHVDSAYAGVFAALPECSDAFQGLEACDSFDTNPHKAMLVTFDCSCLFVREVGWLRAALTLDSQFQYTGLLTANDRLDLKDLQVPLGRRFRALKLWFVLRMYGARELRSYLRHSLELAGALADKIRREAEAEVACDEDGDPDTRPGEAAEGGGRGPAAAAPADGAGSAPATSRPQRRLPAVSLELPPSFGLVCARPERLDAEAAARALERLNASGAAFVTHTLVGGHHVARFAIGGYGTQWRHVESAYEAWKAALLEEEGRA